MYLNVTPEMQKVSEQLITFLNPLMKARTSLLQKMEKFATLNQDDKFKTEMTSFNGKVTNDIPNAASLST